MTTVLLWGASPAERAPLLLSVEFDAIRDAVRRSTYRDEFELHSSQNTQAGELVEDLLTHQPRILHFSGHGRPSGELIFESPDGAGVAVDAATLGETIGRFDDHLAVVVLAACWSQTQAEALTAHIPVVIGLQEEVDDAALLAFGSIFYLALGEGKAVTEAFHLARAQLDLTSPTIAERVTALVQPGTGDLVLAGPGAVGGSDTSAAGSDERAAVVTSAFHAHFGPLVRLVSTLLDDVPGAEEIVKAAFVDLLYAPAPPNDADVAGFLRRKAMDAARSARNRHAAETAATSETDRVLRVIRGMPDPTAEVLLMKHLGALGDDEIADALDVSTSRVAEEAASGFERLRIEVGATP